ncbi:MAG: branched-chain amino acid ABC transporter permease [Thermoleophilia bacterium]|nr:branched-chain amino acid ABC transporter permease [Thermoleophilia bacterium]
MRNALLSVKTALDTAFYGGGLVLALLLFFVVYDNDVFGGHWVLFCLYASINLMWMLVIGTAGLYSFATIAVVGACAYLGALVSGGSIAGTDLEGARSLNVVLMVLAAAGFGALLGALIAAPTIRLRGVYFALFTIGLAEVGRAIVKQHEALGKNSGLFGGSRFLKSDQIATETGRTIHFFVGLALLVFCLLVYRAVEGGRLGLLLRTVRESENVARGIGVDVVRARFAVFIVSSAVLGLIGGFYTGFYGGVSLPIFDFNTLLLLLAMIVVGGLGSAKGAIVGTALLLFIDRTFADLETPAWRTVWIGIIMFAVTLGTTRGLVGIPSQVREYLARRRASREAGGAGPAAAPETAGP